MQITVTNLAMLALAVWQIVEIWRHSNLFAGCRATIEAWPDWDEESFHRACPGRSRAMVWCVKQCVHVQAFVRNVLLCPWCASIWVGLVVAMFWLCLPEWLQWLTFVALGLAISRLANLGNDVTHGLCRTPKANRLPDLHDETDHGSPARHDEPAAPAEPPGGSFAV